MQGEKASLLCGKGAIIAGNLYQCDASIFQTTGRVFQQNYSLHCVPNGLTSSCSGLLKTIPCVRMCNKPVWALHHLSAEAQPVGV